MKKLIAVAALALLTNAAISEEKIKVGVILPLSGAFERYGQRIRASLEDAAPKNITYVYEDEGCDPKVAVNAFRKLSDVDRIDLFVGPWCGSPQMAVAPLIANYKGKKFSLLGSSAPEAVYDASGKNILAVQHSIEEESAYLANYLNEKGVKSVAIIFKENSFSRAHEASFRKVFKGEVLETFAYTTDNISELKNIMIKLKQKRPEALFVPDAYPILLGLFKELNGAGLQDLAVYSVYSAESPDVLDIVKNEAVANLVYTYPKLPDGESDAFHYFPALVTEFLTKAIAECGDKAQCVKDSMLATGRFNDNGILEQGITLKTVKDRKFVAYNE